jgi:hypothetical protein
MANSTADSSFGSFGLENELSGYKSISGGAITSTLLGCMSVLMFVDLKFFFIPLLGLFIGIRALMRIQRYPDVYSGLKLAQAGIGLSALFSLVAFTTSYAFQFNLNRDATVFAQSLEEVLNTGRPEDMIFLKIMPSQRGDFTPDKVVADRMASGMEGKMTLETELKPFKDLADIRKNMSSPIKMDSIEASGFDKLTPYAFVRYSFETKPEAHDHKPGEAEHDHDHGAHDSGGTKYAMLQMKAEKFEGKTRWYVGDFVYPYKANTAKLKEAGAHDGHGH